MQASVLVPKGPSPALPVAAADSLQRPWLMAQLSQAQTGRWLTLTAPSGFGKTTDVHAWVQSEKRRASSTAGFEGEVDAPTPLPSLIRYDNFTGVPDSNASAASVHAWIERYWTQSLPLAFAGLKTHGPAQTPLELRFQTLIHANCLQQWPLANAQAHYHDWAQRPVWIWDQLDRLGTDPVLWRALGLVWRSLAILGVGGILITRGNIDNWLGPLNAELALPLLDLDERVLRWAGPETAALTQRHALPAASCHQIVARCQGWPVAINTAVERLIQLSGAAPSENTLSVLIDNAIDDTFALTTFASVALKAQRCLMLCALMPQLTASDAVALTRQRHANELLQAAVDRGTFVQSVLIGRQQAYRFHPLLRAHLLRAAGRQLDQAVLNPAVLRAAQRLDAINPAAAVALLIQLGTRSSVRAFLLNRVERPNGKLLRDLGMRPVNDLLAHLDPGDIASHGGIALLTSLLSLWRYFAVHPPTDPTPPALVVSPGQAVLWAWDAFAVRGDLQGLADTVLVALHYSMAVAPDNRASAQWATQLQTCLSWSALPRPVQERLTVLESLYQTPMPLWGRTLGIASPVTAASPAPSSLPATRLIELAGAVHRSTLDRLSALLVLLRDHGSVLPSLAAQDWLIQAEQLLSQVADRSPWQHTFAAWVASWWLPVAPERALQICQRTQRQANYALPQSVAWLGCVQAAAALASAQPALALQALPDVQWLPTLSPALRRLWQLLRLHLCLLDARRQPLPEGVLSATRVALPGDDRLCWVTRDDLGRYALYVQTLANQPEGQVLPPTVVQWLQGCVADVSVEQSLADLPEHWVQFGPDWRHPTRHG